MSQPEADCEYIVVGSGAGGGTVAARLAEAGRRVILLEAGGDPRILSGGDAVEPDANRLPYDYDVPAFHGFASENSAMKWIFSFVTTGTTSSSSAIPYRTEVDGRLTAFSIPAPAPLGMHVPQCDDPGLSAQRRLGRYRGLLTSDASRKSDNMWCHFSGLERTAAATVRCIAGWPSSPIDDAPWLEWMAAHRKGPSAFSGLQQDTCGNAGGFSRGGLCGGMGHQTERIRWFLESGLDPNDWRPGSGQFRFRCYLPLTTRWGISEHWNA